MKNIVLFDTSIGTMNHGDDIIMTSFSKNAVDILENNFVIKYPTHTPCFLSYQQLKRNKRFRFIDEADYKFICGTNIINNHMVSPWPFWNINFFNSRCYKDAVLVGVGVSGFHGSDDKMSTYSKLLFSSFLSKKYIHSTRDKRTQSILTNIGINAINTGCPTMWGLTKKHCSEIPFVKSDSVVFTLTDYAADRANDQEFINLLLSNYKDVYYWPQGTQDYEYFSSFFNVTSIKLISPDIKSYSNVLSGDIDYVGTRLHAGIYAMQYKKRAIILSVDNRAKDIANSYCINTVERTDLKQIKELINSSFKTNVRLNEDNINLWKSQFI